MESRRRVFLAVAIPMTALLAAAVLIWSISRVFLAVSVNAAPVVGILVAINILVAAALAASLPRRGAIIGLILAVVVPVVASGIVAAIAGERPVHSLVGEEDGGGDHGDGKDGGGGGDKDDGGNGDAEPLEIVAIDLAFDKDTLELPPETEVTLVFDNREAVPHNWSMYAEEGGEPIFQGEVITGPDTIEYTFTTPTEGTYYFQCDVHPDMNGTVEVAADGGGGGGGGGASTLSIVAVDLTFDQTELSVPPETEVTVELVNEDVGTPHNWSAYTEQGGEVIVQGELVTGPATVETTFTSPGPGSYYFQCDVHPDMNGTLTVA